MIKKTCLFLLLFVAAAPLLKAQLVNGKDTSFIQQFKKLRNIQLNTWVTDVQFDINPRLTNKNYKVSYRPNTKGQMGMSFGLKSITLFLGFQIPGTEAQTDTYGKTSFIDFSFGYFKNHWGGEIFYRHFDGLYQLKNDTLLLTKRPDAQLTNYGISVYYVFNKKHFSYRSALVQQELQTKSAGSFAVLFNVQHRSIVGDSSLIPPAIDNASNFRKLEGLTALYFNTVNIRPGYAHNFVFKKGLYFVSPSLFAGMGVGSYNLKGANGSLIGFNTDFDIHAKFSVGFNHKQWFGNVYLVYENNFNVFETNLVSLQISSFGVNIGYRLNSFFRVKWL